MKRTLVTLLAILAALSLSACGKRESSPAPTAVPTDAPAAVSVPAPTPTLADEATPAPSAAPTAAPTLAPTAAPVTLSVPAGDYVWTDEDGNAWTLSLKESGLFAVIAPDGIYNGEGWSTESDGSVLTGPTEAAGKAAFFDEFGCSCWRIIGTDRCEPLE